MGAATRRGHRKREYYAKWLGGRQPEWDSEKFLCEAISQEQLSACFDPEAAKTRVILLGATKIWVAFTVWWQSLCELQRGATR